MRPKLPTATCAARCGVPRRSVDGPAETLGTKIVSTGVIMGEMGRLRERVIDYAGPRFFQEGFSRITTEELSRDLGISKKTLYREFGTKEAIVRAVVRRQLDRVERELAQVFDDESRSFVDRLAAQLEVAGRMVGTLGKPFLRDLARFAPEIWKEIEEFRHRRVFSRLEGMVRRGIEEGVIRRETDPRLLVMIITTVADTLLVPGKLAELDILPGTVIEQVGMLVAGGVLSEEGRAQFPGIRSPGGFEYA